MIKVIRNAFLVITLICYLSVLISPEIFWIFGFFSLAIPLILGIHFLLLIINIPGLKKAFFIHLLFLIFGLVFIKITYSVSSNDNKGKLKVLSYNVRIFNNYASLRNENYVSSKKMIAWSVEHEASIKCFQEYYNQDKSTVFNVKNQLSNAGWKHFHGKIVHKDRSGAEFGLAIYSKFPIINHGEVVNDHGVFLNSIFADILIDADTFRIYNTHLESMSIDEEDVINTDRLAYSYRDTGYRLKNGFISRANQLQQLVKDIRDCPHKIILCGDLNEVPYSYAYFKLRRYLNNAFEKSGNGFGFTYNGKLFFLRIDNQFYSPSMNIHSMIVHRNIDYSDHFPLTASYSW